MFDAVDGVSVGRIVAGTGTEVDISPYFDAMGLGRHYIALHTHPGSSPFSLRDVALFFETRRLSHSFVVGADGSWFALSRDRRGTRLTARHARLLIAAAFERWRPVFEVAAQMGALTPQEALDALLDQLWRRLGSALGVRYDTTRQFTVRVP